MPYVGQRALTVDDRRHLALDVAAFQDAAVHCMTKPCTIAELKERFVGSVWVNERTDWQAAHREYVDNFEREIHDPDTLNWRDQRNRRIARASRPETHGRNRRRA